MTSSEEEFILSHVFTDVSSMKEGVHYSPIEEHFRMPWKIGVVRTSDHLGLYLYCLQKNEKEWSIDVSQEVKITTVNGKTHSRNSDDIYKSTDKGSGWGWSKFISWEDLMENYVIDDTVTVKFRVKIKKMTGIPLRSFNESVKEFSDTVLTVENQKFYVSKLFLASQSSFFKSLLLKLSECEEHTLENVKTRDFQMFLELLHGENSISDSTIKGIAHLADMYGAKTAMEKCEQFLVKNSRKSLKEKLHLAHLYKLEKLKNHCLSKISTVSEIRSVLTDDLSEMDPVVSGALLQKFMANYEKTLEDLLKKNEKNEKTVFVLTVLSAAVLCTLIVLCIRIVF